MDREQALWRAGRWLLAGWSILTRPLGWLVSHLLLALVFYLVITPLGLVRRLLHRDPLALRFEPGLSSYWTERRGDDSLDSTFRQF